MQFCNIVKNGQQVGPLTDDKILDQTHKSIPRSGCQVEKINSLFFVLLAFFRLLRKSLLENLPKLNETVNV